MLVLGGGVVVEVGGFVVTGVDNGVGVLLVGAVVVGVTGVVLDVVGVVGVVV